MKRPAKPDPSQEGSGCTLFRRSRFGNHHAKIFQAAQLRAPFPGVLAAAGSSPQEAKTVADNLVLANLSGHDSHGVGMVPRYMEAVLEGGLKPNTGVAVKLDGGSLLALDGQRGYGQVVGEQAMALACSARRTAAAA